MLGIARSMNPGFELWALGALKGSDSKTQCGKIFAAKMLALGLRSPMARGGLTHLDGDLRLMVFVFGGVGGPH